MKLAQRSRWWMTSVSGFLAALAGLCAAPTQSKNVIDEWATVKAPPPPTLKAVNVDPASTALIVMDLSRQSCSAAKRPRCVAMLPAVHRLIAEARASGVFVIYTLVGTSKRADIPESVAPLDSEQSLSGAGPDKFIGSDLEAIVKAKHIKTIIAVGTAAEGAVLHTAAGAAFRGFDVVVPVDGMSSTKLYAEQYTAWHLANAPRLAEHIKLTTVDMINFSPAGTVK